MKIYLKENVKFRESVSALCLLLWIVGDGNSKVLLFKSFHGPSNFDSNWLVSDYDAFDIFGEDLASYLYEIVWNVRFQSFHF